MQRYGAYKDSGVEWIGEIPEGWEISKGKALYDITTGKLDVNAGEDDGAFPFFTCSMQPRRINEYAFDCEALLVAGNGIVGFTQYYKGKFNAYQRTYVLSNFRNVYPGFLRYYVSNNLMTEVAPNSVGSVIQFIKMGDLRNFIICAPPLSEQQAIADYLDWKTAEIDSIVSQTERSIELLREYRKSVISEAVTKGLDPDAPMKDSGVEWIGEIPTGWGIGRMGDIAQYKKGPFGSSLTIGMFVDEKRAVAKVYEQKNAIQADASLGHYYIDAQKYKELEAFEVKPGDIIVSCAGTIGKCFEIPVGAYPGIINQALMRVRLNSGLDKRYFLFLFEVVLDAMAIIYSNGSAIKNIPPFSTLKPFKIPLPFFEKQQAIADYLDEKTAEIDSLIADKQRQVELLKEYRKSFISEAVTGKFKVPGLE